VLVEAARHWAKIKANPEPYARRIMYTRNIDRWRSRRSKEISFESVPDYERGEDSSNDSDRRLVLQQALSRLTAKQRAVLILRFYEDQPESYTAAVLNCSAGTVKSQTRHALKRIRELAPDLLVDFEPHPASDRTAKP